MPNRISVTSADFIRNVGYWQNEAVRNPISITHHGRERLILTTPDQFLPRGSANTEDIENSLMPLRATQAVLFEQMDDGYLELDEQLRIVAANRSAENLSLRSQEQLLGAKVFDCLPEPFGSIVAERAGIALRSRKPSSFDAGSPGGLTLSGRTFPLGSKVAVFLRNSSREEELRRERDDLLALRQAFSDHALVTFVRVDQRARISDAGELFCSWLDFTSSELVGHRLADLTDAALRREVATSLEQVLRDGGRARTDVVLVRRGGGTLSCMASVAGTMRDGVVMGATCIFVATSTEGRIAAE